MGILVWYILKTIKFKDFLGKVNQWPKQDKIVDVLQCLMLSVGVPTV